MGEHGVRREGGRDRGSGWEEGQQEGGKGRGGR